MAPVKSEELRPADLHASGMASSSAPSVSRRLLIGVPLVALSLSLLIGGTTAWLALGVSGLLVCLVVWAVIAVSSALSYFAGSVFSSPEMAQLQIMIGMMVRTGVPLLFALIVTQAARHWLDAGFVYYLLGFYFVGLVVDVFLVLVTSPGFGQMSAATGSSVRAGRS